VFVRMPVFPRLPYRFVHMRLCAARMNMRLRAVRVRLHIFGFQFFRSVVMHHIFLKVDSAIAAMVYTYILISVLIIFNTGKRRRAAKAAHIRHKARISQAFIFTGARSGNSPPKPRQTIAA